ncbi:MAG: AMP-binding protein, partial [Pseudomonas paracarnis]
MPVAFRLPLQVFFEREARHPRKVFLVQPIGGGEVQALTWGDVGHQARCAAHWLRARELPQGSHIALISKNCAHWIIADLAIWMAGHVSVPLYPNLTADSVAHVLTHSQARLALIGKLDDW